MIFLKKLIIKKIILTKYIKKVIKFSEESMLDHGGSEMFCFFITCYLNMKTFKKMFRTIY